MVRLNIAKSRIRSAILVRIDQTCFGPSGGSPVVRGQQSRAQPQNGDTYVLSALGAQQWILYNTLL